MTTVALAGDWHGNTTWALRAITQCAAAGITRIYHLGDFGIWPGRAGAHYLDQVDRATQEHDVAIWVTPGNHEDYSQINALPAPDAGNGLLPLRRRITVIPRGHRWRHGGRTFVSLGGAPSIDYEHRTEHVSWWRDEAITPAEADRVAAGGYADVMLAHGAPNSGTDAVAAIVDDPRGWSSAALAYAAEGRTLMDIAVRGVQPKVFAHGHYHVADDTGPHPAATRYLALAGDNQPRNVALLRLDDLAVSWDGSTWS